MARIFPFRGVRPRNELAASVIALPYDVMSEAEARALVDGNPHSFLRVTRSEVELPEGVDAHSPEAYQKAREVLDRFQDDGTLMQDDSPAFYLYTLTWKGRSQTGLMAACSVEEYDRGEIKKHELTRPDKEQDRVEHMQTLDAQVGLVFLAYRDQFQSVKDAMTRASALEPAWCVTTEDGVTHALTPILEKSLVEEIQGAFAEVPSLYIADGHHRSAAASRVSAAREGAGNSARFLAGLFPDSQLEVLAYNRVVVDLNGHSESEFLTRLEEKFVVEAGVEPVPSQRGRWTVYLGGVWYGLEAKEGVVPENDPVHCLDAAVLQNEVLGPLLGISDPRRDKRVAFVGGIRGHEALSGAVDKGAAAVAFHLYPTGLDQLFAVADADKLMPPKCTWFEPKLRGGVVFHKLSEDV